MTMIMSTYAITNNFPLAFIRKMLRSKRSVSIQSNYCETSSTDTPQGNGPGIFAVLQREVVVSSLCRPCGGGGELRQLSFMINIKLITLARNNKTIYSNLMRVGVGRTRVMINDRFAVFMFLGQSSSAGQVTLKAPRLLFKRVNWSEFLHTYSLVVFRSSSVKLYGENECFSGVNFNTFVKQLQNILHSNLIIVDSKKLIKSSPHFIPPSGVNLRNIHSIPGI